MPLRVFFFSGASLRKNILGEEFPGSGKPCSEPLGFYIRILQQAFYYVNLPQTVPAEPQLPQNSGEEGGSPNQSFEDRLLFLTLSNGDGP